MKAAELPPESPPTPGRLKSLQPWLVVLALVALVGVLLRHGLPLNAWTWSVLGLLALACLGIGKLSAWKRACLALCLLYLLVPWPFQLIPVIYHDALFDDRGGRRGIHIMPGLWFGKPGPNTELLEWTLGPLEANWREQCPLSPHIRDGNERVHSRNLIFQGHLAYALRLLPSDEARARVLGSLVDTRNLLRAHQSLLLECLSSMGLPTGYTSERWWSEHAWAFSPVYDAKTAARMTWDWLNETREFAPRHDGSRWLTEFQNIESQRDAAEYQEQGRWGGDRAFRTASFDARVGRSRTPLQPSRIAWWPPYDSR